MATASEAARSRDEAEEEAETLYQAAVAYVAAQAAQGQEDEEDDGLSFLQKALIIAAVVYAYRLLRSTPKRYGSEIDLDDIEDFDIDAMSEDIGEDIARLATKHAEQHLSTITKRERKKNPDVTDPEIRETFRSNSAWSNAAARTSTTETAAQTAIDLLPYVEDMTGEKHELLWVSRGDHRVRKSHRRLHGKVRKFGKPFKISPAGQPLRFPGDPLAPLGETINCRCSLLLVPARQARDAMDVFGVDEENWDVIDSLRASVGWVDAVDGVEQAVHDLLTERNV